MTLGPCPLPPAPLRGTRIGIIGAGTMGRALIEGLLASGVPRRALAVSDPDAAARRHLQERCRLSLATADNTQLARRADVLVLAVKPKQVPEVVAGIAPHVTRRHLVLSIAAGIRVRWLQRHLRDTPVGRVMPNLAATVGCGFSAMTFGRLVSPRHQTTARALFEAVGEVVELPERLFDAITAVSGSGPAYLFFFVDAWRQAARRLGMPADIAERAIRQTLRGSLRLMEASGASPEELIRRVASRRGTTEAALKVLARRQVAAHVVEAVRAAARRSRELSCGTPRAP